MLSARQITRILSAKATKPLASVAESPNLILTICIRVRKPPFVRAVNVLAGGGMKTDKSSARRIVPLSEQAVDATRSPAPPNSRLAAVALDAFDALSYGGGV